MVFSSLPFLFRFLPAVLICYFIVPKKAKNTVLFLLSLIFYAWGEPVYIVLMLFSTAVDFILGGLTEHFSLRGKRNYAKLMVAISAIINLSLLGWFKYAGFFTLTVNSAFGLSIPVPEHTLPIGISFYTFQTMSYTIGIYRGEAKAQRNIINFGTYVALFPQLIAGPIVQYKDIAEQLTERHVTPELFSQGILRFTVGLGKKVLLANSIGALWSEISAHDASSLPVLAAWMGACAFAFQIYFDFSGYSDMAIGLGKMFGFDFPENFSHPYISGSITEFWRRWHITLGTWFRENVYIPLGGNRVSIPRQIFNLSVVWILTGFWHGAGWNFIAWGAWFGFLLIIEKFLLKKHLAKAPYWLCRTYTLLAVLISWVIFACEDGSWPQYLGSMAGISGAGFADTETIYLLYTNIILFIIVSIGSTGLPLKLALKVKNSRIGTSSTLIFTAAVFLLSVAYLVDASYNPFLYFRF